MQNTSRLRVAGRHTLSHDSIFVLGWITDQFRIVWGFFYWNSRKSIFRLGGARGTCPCQNQSDSGRGGETGCDPALHFAQPVRFRTVCPLLQRGEDGRLMCSVDADKVRPFWGRVILGSVALVILLYVTIVISVFGFLRQVGYPVTLKTIGWPPAWSEIDQARSLYFLKNAQHAYQSGDLSETVMSLSLAYDYDPYNYEAGFFLARLWQAGRPEVSNHLYEKLIIDHPEHRTQTAQAWLRSLLPRADYGWIEKLATSALRFSDDNAAAWLHALLFAHTHTANDEVFENLLGSPEHLTHGVQTVLEWESALPRLSPAQGRRLLRQGVPDETPSFVIYYQIRRLIALGFPSDALDILNSNGSRLGDRDRISLQLRAFAVADFRRSYEGLFDRLTRLSPNLVQFEIIASHLIIHPDQVLYQKAKRRLDPGTLPTRDQQLPAMLAMFCLAGAHRDVAYQQTMAARMRDLTGSKFTILDMAMAVMSSDDPAKVGLPRILPALQPLSLDLTYALLERYDSAENK